MNDNERFASYLGVDYERAGGGTIRIVCPFHDDHKPSLLIYQTMERGACCYACGETPTWPWIAQKIKGIHYKQALEDLKNVGLLPLGYDPKPYVPETQFCEVRNDALRNAYKDRHSRCSTDYPDEMVEFLSRKGILEVAKELDWRWHDGSVFKGWGKGIVIPYTEGDDIVYERIRELEDGAFGKPKGSFQVSIQPYLTTFRPNSVQFIVEGESDAATIYKHGASALSTPGAVSKKAINSIVAFCADRQFIKSIIVCGDNDEAGCQMNELVKKTVRELCPRIVVKEFRHKLTDKGADVNDEEIAGNLKIPIQCLANYGSNYNRQPWADKDFGEFVDKFSDKLKKYDEAGLDPWKPITPKKEEPQQENEQEQEKCSQPSADVNNDKSAGDMTGVVVAPSTCDDDLPVKTISIQRPRYHDKTVAVAVYKIPASKHFKINLETGAYKGVYEVFPEDIGNSWLEKLRKGDNYADVRVWHLDELKKI